MKRKITFEYDEVTGHTSATLCTKYGNFYGEAQISKDDPFPPSYSIGEKIAESRAYINYYKSQYNDKKQQKKGIERLMNAIPYKNPGWLYAYNLSNAIAKEMIEIDKDIKFYQERERSAVEARMIYIRSRTTDRKAKEKYLENLGNAIKQLGEVKNN